MELEILLKALLSLGSVFAVMYIALKILQKYTNIGNHSSKSKSNGGLKLENIVYIDEANKVVNISNNLGVNYVIAVGKNNSFLIDKYKKNIDRESTMGGNRKLEKNNG